MINGKIRSVPLNIFSGVGITLCPSIYIKEVMDLFAFIFEHPSYQLDVKGEKSNVPPDNHDYPMHDLFSIFNLKRLSLQIRTFFEIFYFLFKSFVKVELSYVFTINLFTIAENCAEK